MRLQGKVTIVTGGTSGIGRATAVLFGREGAKVVLTGRDEVRGRVVLHEVKSAGAEAMFVRSDVRLPSDCRRAVEEALKAWGRVDILFNNAGVFFPRTVPDCSEEEWDMTIDVNLKGTFLMSKAVLPHMIERRSGIIVNNASGWGLVGGDAAAAYCASKGGVVLLTKAMAIDHGKHGIRINCICPGDVDTPMLPDDAKQRGQSWDDYLKGASNRPMGRIGKPDEIARAVLFLSTEDSSFMTGSSLVVDGGGSAD